ncbi:hypothetical protein [Halocatena marina]|uniref:hypothetical protein n=1 Tax=Halocatena marina TaxID=2934937 RepID=UPI00200C7C5B|nr:hypothetical protein [Halocatena marina]
MSEERPSDQINGRPEPTPRSAFILVSEAVRRLRTNPSVVFAMLAAGVVVAGVDWLRLHDPVPTTGFVGIQDGRFVVSFDVVITVLSQTTVPLSSLIELKLPWLVWSVGIDLLGLAVVVGAGAYALARLLDVPLTASATLQYAVAVFFLEGIIGQFQFENVTIVVAIPLVVVVFFLAVRLFAVPGLLIADFGSSAFRQSWERTRGNGWSLFYLVLLIGGANHLLASVPLFGPIGSALVGALHAGTVASFLEQRRMMNR